MADRQGPVSCVPGKGGSLHSFFPETSRNKGGRHDRRGSRLCHAPVFSFLIPALAVRRRMGTAEWEVMVPPWWSREHTFAIAMVMAVLLPILVLLVLLFLY
jgi:hypothetical protein